MSGLMLDDVKILHQKFGVADYMVFVAMLVICALIGRINLISLYCYYYYICYFYYDRCVFWFF